MCVVLLKNSAAAFRPCLASPGYRPVSKLLICIENWPTFRTQSYLPKWVGDWSDRRGITWNYSALAPSWPCVFKGDIQTIGYLSKHRRYLRAETVEPAYADRRSPTSLDKYAFKLSAGLKTKATKSRKQRRTLKQMHIDLCVLGYEGPYDRGAAVARQWKVDQWERGNFASKSTACRQKGEKDPIGIYLASKLH